MFYFFGVFFIVIGIKMLFVFESELNIDKNVIVCFLCKYMWVMNCFYD